MTTPSAYQPWVALIERYFDAQTSEAEEAQLRAFLLSEEGASPQFDEVRAVMGLAAVLRRGETSASRPATTARRSLRPWTKIAASLFISLTLGLSIYAYRWHHPDCIAYIDGHRVTNRERVLHEMEMTLRSVVTEDIAEPTLEDQMQDLFSTLETASTSSTTP